MDFLTPYYHRPLNPNSVIKVSSSLFGTWLLEFRKSAEGLRRLTILRLYLRGGGGEREKKKEKKKEKKRKEVSGAQMIALFFHIRKSLRFERSDPDRESRTTTRGEGLHAYIISPCW